MVTELSNIVAEKIRGLWPDAKWTEQTRQLWIKELATRDPNKVVEALEHHYKNGYRQDQPNLKEVLVKYHADAQEQSTAADLPTQEQLDDEAFIARAYCSDIPLVDRLQALEVYAWRTGKHLPDDVDEWNDTQCKLFQVIHEDLQ